MPVFTPFGFFAGGGQAVGVRIDAATSERFRRPAASIPGSTGFGQTTWSFSVRRRATGTMYVHTAGQPASWGRLTIASNGKVTLFDRDTVGTKINITSNDAVPAETWTHVHVVRDITLAAANRVKMWIDGVQSTTTNATNDAGISMNFNVAFDNFVGYDANATAYGGGDLALFYFLDTTAEPVTRFGDTAGTWKRKDPGTGLVYSGAGFFLDFANADDLGNDSANGLSFLEDNIDATNALGDGPELTG